MFGSICWKFGSKRITQQDIINAMEPIYVAVLFIGITKGSFVQPVVYVERFVSYRAREVGMYSVLPFAFAQVTIEFPYVFIQALMYIVPYSTSWHLSDGTSGSLLRKMEELNDQLTKKKAQIAHMMEKTSKVRRMTGELQQSLSLAAKEKLVLEEEWGRRYNYIKRWQKRSRCLNNKYVIWMSRILEMSSTQAEEHDMEVKLKEFQDEIDSANALFQRLSNEEDTLRNIS